MAEDRRASRAFREYKSFAGCFPYSETLPLISSALDDISSRERPALWPKCPIQGEVENLWLAGVNEWTLETLMRDTLAYGGMFGSRSIANWDDFANLANRLRDVENLVWGDFGNSEWILSELFRIQLRQFPWQRGLGHRYISKYLHMYGHAQFGELLQEEFGLDGQQLIAAAMVLHERLGQGAFLPLPLNFNFMDIDSSKVMELVDRISITPTEALSESQANSVLDVNFAYRRSPFLFRPIVRLEKRNGEKLIFCPIRRYLLERMVDGVYYDLVKRNDFSNPYGRAFEGYIGSAIGSLTHDSKNTYLPEQKYGPKRKREDSCDFIISDETADVFVECKVRRVSYAGKTDLTSLAPIEAELEKLSKTLFQSYKTVNDALAGRYRHWAPRSLPTYLLVVLLHPFDFTDKRLFDEMIKRVEQRLVAADISPSVIAEAPLTVVSSDDVIDVLCVLRGEKIDRFFAQKTSDGFASWGIHGFLQNQYPSLLEKESHVADRLDSAFNELVERASS